MDHLRFLKHQSGWYAGGLLEKFEFQICHLPKTGLTIAWSNHSFSFYPTSQIWCASQWQNLDWNSADKKLQMWFSGFQVLGYRKSLGGSRNGIVIPLDNLAQCIISRLCDFLLFKDCFFYLHAPNTQYTETGTRQVGIQYIDISQSANSKGVRVLKSGFIGFNK